MIIVKLDLLGYKPRDRTRYTLQSIIGTGDGWSTVIVRDSHTVGFYRVCEVLKGPPCFSGLDLDDELERVRKRRS